MTKGLVSKYAWDRFDGPARLGFFPLSCPICQHPQVEQEQQHHSGLPKAWSCQKCNAKFCIINEAQIGIKPKSQLSAADLLSEQDIARLSQAGYTIVPKVA